MTTNKLNFKTLPSSVDYLNDAVLGLDPETKVLSRLYEGDKPLQDRVTNLEADQVDLRETSIRLEQLADAAEAVVGNKADKLVLTNLAKNGNMSGTTDYGTFGGTLSANANILTLTGGNTTTVPSVNQITNAVLSNGIKLYIAIKVKHTNKQPTGFDMLAYGSSPLVLINTVSFPSPTLNSEYFMSMIAQPTTQTVNLRVLFNPKYADIPTAENSTTQFREFIVVNLTEIFGAGKEPSKGQMDLILRYTGFFQSKELNLADVLKITAAPTQEAWKPLTLLNGNVASGSPHITPQYMKDSMGFVHFKGTYDSVGTGYAKYMGQVPTGYRPDRNIYFPVGTNGTIGLIYIDTGGYIWMTGTDTARPLTDISGMTYQAGA